MYVFSVRLIYVYAHDRPSALSFHDPTVTLHGLSLNHDDSHPRYGILSACHGGKLMNNAPAHRTPRKIGYGVMANITASQFLPIDRGSSGFDSPYPSLFFCSLEHWRINMTFHRFDAKAHHSTATALYTYMQNGILKAMSVQEAQGHQT